MNKKFWLRVGIKIVETAVSVKVLTIAAVMIVSTILVSKGLISGDAWAMVNGGVISTVYALREGFKVARFKNGTGEQKKDIMV
jgi:hypothetical protein